MRSLILCEGFDDILILGYYLYKTKKWKYNSKAKFSDKYSFPKLDRKRENIEIYERDNDMLGIWAVGGKNSFDHAYRFVKTIHKDFPGEIQKIFIMMDRDAENICDTLIEIQKKLKESGWMIADLQNAEKNQVTYCVDDDIYFLEVIPVIIPYSRNGALENVLMDGIAETGEEERYIVKQANQFVDGLMNSNQLEKYLTHDRLVVKSKLSACISITNPDRSTALFDQLLMSWEWEKMGAVKRHFEPIARYLDE